MKRLITVVITLSLVAFFITDAASAQQYEREWEASAAQDGSPPSYIGTDNDATGLAYGVVDDGNGNQVERVFVATVVDDFTIKVLDANDGSDTGNDLSGVAGLSTPSNGRTVTDVGVTDDGIIVACNEVNNKFFDPATENFQCWRWDDLQDSPTEIVNFTPPDNSDDDDDEGDWIGRQFTLDGSAEDNSLTLLTAAVNNSATVYRFTDLVDNDPSTTSVSEIERTDSPPVSNIHGVAPKATSSSKFLFNEATTAPRRYSANGAEEAEDPGAFTAFTWSLKSFEVNGREWMVTFNWEDDGTGQNAELGETTNGVENAEFYGSTPELGGDNENENLNGTGDVDVRVNDDGTATIFVLSTNNGVGGFTTTQDLGGNFEREWEKSKGQENRPGYIASGQDYLARGLAYGEVDSTADGDSKEVVLVASNAEDGSPGPYTVYVVDAMTGEMLGKLDTEGIEKDGFRFINDVGVSEDGKIFACNAARLTQTFYCFQWDHLSDSPTTVVSGLNTPARIGSNISVTGSKEDNTLQIHTADVNSDTLFQIESDFSVTKLSTSSESNTPNVEDAYPNPDGGYYHTYVNVPAERYDTTESVAGQLPTGVADSLVSLNIFEVEGARYLVGATNNFTRSPFPDSTGVEDRARLANITDGANNATMYGETPRLGNTPQFQGNGDAAVRVNDDGTATIFHLATNDGIGAFRTTGILSGAGSRSPVTAPGGVTASLSDGEVSVSWNESSSENVTEYRIYRDTAPIEGSPADSEPLATVDASRTVFAEEAPESGQTYYYAVTAVDVDDNESPFSGQASIFLYPEEVTAQVSRSFGAAAGPGDYRLVALPGAIDRPLEETVSGEADVQWQAYWDDGTDSDFFVEFDGSDTFTFQKGNGFWLTATSDWTFEETVSSVELQEENAATIDLRSGWNIVSNPFEKEVSWSAVEAASTADGEDLAPLWPFEGSFDESAETFAPATEGQAYYFLNDNDLEELVVPYPGAPQMQKAAPTSREETPMLALTASTADNPASRIEVGFSDTEESVVAPPGRFEPVSLRIEAEEAAESKRGRYLMAVKRSVDGEGETIPLRLSSGAEGPVELSARNLDAVDVESVALLHPSAGTTYDLQQEESVSVDVNGGATELKLTVGSKNYVENEADEVVPDEVKLTSYPNPVGQQGTVEYALPEAQEVTLRVYDVLGREVATLEQGRKDAGRHTVQLKTGRLSSGVYFGRLQTEEQTLTQKITVVR